VTLTPFDICLLAVDGAETSDEVRCRILAECWAGLENFPAAVVGEPWTEAALATLATASGKVDRLRCACGSWTRHLGRLVAEGICKGKLRTRQTLLKTVPDTFHGVDRLGQRSGGRGCRAGGEPVEPAGERWSPALSGFYGREDMRRLWRSSKKTRGWCA